jgi:hypothetical protein
VTDGRLEGGPLLGIYLGRGVEQQEVNIRAVRKVRGLVDHNSTVPNTNVENGHDLFLLVAACVKDHGRPANRFSCNRPKSLTFLGDEKHSVS